jgi:hypothetical protein
MDDDLITEQSLSTTWKLARVAPATAQTGPKLPLTRTTPPPAMRSAGAGAPARHLPFRDAILSREQYEPAAARNPSRVFLDAISPCRDGGRTLGWRRRRPLAHGDLSAHHLDGSGRTLGGDRQVGPRRAVARCDAVRSR